VDPSAQTAIKELEVILPLAWSRATSADPQGWTRKNPAWGQCAVTALLIQDACGGTLVRTNAYTPGNDAPIGHYFVRMADGVHIDLTRNQFPEGTTFSENTEERSREYVLDPKFSTRKRYRLLKRRLAKAQKTKPLL